MAKKKKKKKAKPTKAQLEKELKNKILDECGKQGVNRKALAGKLVVML